MKLKLLYAKVIYKNTYKRGEKHKYKQYTRYLSYTKESNRILTFTQLESILRTTFDLEGSSIKEVSDKAGINSNSLYKWNSSAMRFSPENMDRLILYFMEHEHTRLDRAVEIFDALQGID